METVKGTRTNLGSKYSKIRDITQRRYEDVYFLKKKETDSEAFDKLSDKYCTVVFYYVNTGTRGEYELVAFCRDIRAWWFNKRRS